MFQDFSSISNPSLGKTRTTQLRQGMALARLDGFLVPRSDEHLGEYVPPSAERLKWLTGFSGSAGLAIVLERKAAIFVDGRYTLQARQQVETSVYEVHEIPEADPADWLAGAVPRGATVGFDPWLHSAAFIRSLTEKLEAKGVQLKPVARNPLDQAWGKSRPKPPAGAVSIHPLSLTGQDAAEKIAAAQKTLEQAGEIAAVIASPESICWLLNIRGKDIPHTPSVLSFLILYAKGKPELFIAPEKLDGEAGRYLGTLVKVRKPSELSERLAALKKLGRRVRMPLAGSPFALWRKLGARARLIVDAADPCVLPRARKNAVEIRGARIAHRRDGAAVVRFLAWLDREAAGGALDEITAVRRLEALRAETQSLKEISFDTISGSGPNGAIVHYRVNEATNRRLGKGELFLVDSGAQYPEGTTDITRTIAIGKPTAEMRERFTLVLKGHIAVARARFPKGTPGAALDTLARQALWARGLDFDHGTGHGVGSYLSVHEGPHGLSKRSLVPLEPGMIVSNEPGYYKEGAYGIRLENLLVVNPGEPVPGGERDLMSFETLTLVPFDRRLVDVRLMDEGERAWLDGYHRRVLAEIGPELSSEDRAWLTAAAAPL